MSERRNASTTNGIWPEDRVSQEVDFKIGDPTRNIAETKPAATAPAVPLSEAVQIVQQPQA